MDLDPTLLAPTVPLPLPLDKSRRGSLDEGDLRRKDLCYGIVYTLYGSNRVLIPF